MANEGSGKFSIGSKGNTIFVILCIQSSSVTSTFQVDACLVIKSFVNMPSSSCFCEW